MKNIRIKVIAMALCLSLNCNITEVVASTIVNSSIELSSAKKKKKTTGVNGTYYCVRTHEYYKFNSNHTGSFVTGAMTSRFKWTLKGSFVIITYPNGGGKTELQYNRSKNYFLESSSIYGTLVYEKTTSR